MTGRLAVATLVLAFAAGGCGGVPVRDAPPMSDRTTGLGLSIELPRDWSARILEGADGLPVFHAANFALPTVDDDHGSVAQETIGSRGQAYVNVRDLGATDQTTEPTPFDASDFAIPSGPGSRCCFVTTAAHVLATGGHALRVTVASGSEAPPTEALVDELNQLLATLSVDPYEESALPPLSSEQINAYGLTMGLPQGWQGDVRAGELRAEGAGIELSLQERGGSDAIGNMLDASVRLPRLSPSEFVPGESAQAATGRLLLQNGRRFLLSATSASMPPAADALAEANSALASLAVEAGDFYPGTVEPATFAAADGWTTGNGGSVEVEPGGYGTFSWASTTPYLDTQGSLPPRETLEHLPPEGIVLTVWLWTPVAEYPRLPDRIRVEDGKLEQSWEGQMRDFPRYRILMTKPGQYNADLWIFFGRREPTESQLARAQAELDRLELPDWSG